MPTTYKGLTVPVSTDLADGPKAFRDYTDTLPASDALAALVGGVNFRVFTDAAAMNAWAAPLGALAHLAIKPNAFDPEVCIPHTRLPVAGVPTWVPHLKGIVTGSGGVTSGTVNFVVPFPYDPSQGSHLILSSDTGGIYRVVAGTLTTTGFDFTRVSGTAGTLSWSLGPYQSFD